ncbi:MAG: hypothetical protein MZV64_27655 [Ignavibacteriales bacterium]|nr:hypothetical protein [Ignavibacteriales bacterium]
MFEKYGKPDELTPTMLIWYNNDPWKRSVVYREGAASYGFPITHCDTLEQVIDYQVPLGKYDALAEFDGSVVAYRTLGEFHQEAR